MGKEWQEVMKKRHNKNENDFNIPNKNANFAVKVRQKYH